jgi:hypothetical protein
MMRRFPEALGVLCLVGALATGGCGTADSANDTNGNGACARVVENGGGTIPEPPDGPSLCPSGNACNYQSQEGCAEGRNCFPALNATMDLVAACEPAGAGTTGDACDEWSDCARGYGCPDGQCRKLCCGGDWSDDACDPGEACYRELLYTIDEGDPNDDSDDVNIQSGAYLCYPTGCDLFTSDECPSNSDCKIIDPTGRTACMPPSPERLGERCTPPSVCGRGLNCVGRPGEERCRKLCRAEECGKPACGAGEGTCVHFNRNPEGVGECTPGWEDFEE